jgi:phage FluMu protein Com
MGELRCAHCGKKLLEADVRLDCKCPRCKRHNAIELTKPECLRASTEMHGGIQCKEVQSDGSVERGCCDEKS